MVAPNVIADVVKRFDDDEHADDNAMARNSNEAECIIIWWVIVAVSKCREPHKRGLDPFFPQKGASLVPYVETYQNRIWRELKWGLIMFLKAIPEQLNVK